nr:methionine ABC transporter permease [Pajaroellobacter abortibovis]
MVVGGGLIGMLFGIPLGILLFTTRPSGAWPHKYISMVLGAVVNAGRSCPFLILMVAILPLTRFLTGSSIGTAAAIVPLGISAIPFVGRIVEGALTETAPGLIEAALSMGASPSQVVFKVLLPESLPRISHGITVMLVSLVGSSAMAGALGGGGLGDLAIRYGYQRFNTPLMIITVIILICFVQLIQIVGDWTSHTLDHRG